MNDEELFKWILSLNFKFMQKAYFFLHSDGLWMYRMEDFHEFIHTYIVYSTYIAKPIREYRGIPELRAKKNEHFTYDKLIASYTNILYTVYSNIK